MCENGEQKVGKDILTNMNNIMAGLTGIFHVLLHEMKLNYNKKKHACLFLIVFYYDLILYPVI